VAVRNKLWHPEIVRQRIKVSQLLNRLQDQALNGTELKDGQQKAIEILLRKSLPDLAAVEHTHQGPNGQPIQISSVDAEL
jgi:hypothetical protein